MLAVRLMGCVTTAQAPGSAVLSYGQDHAEVEAEKKKEHERLDALRCAW